MKARSQHRLLVGPGGAFDHELSKEAGLLVLRLLLGLLEKLRLFHQLRDKPVALFSQLAALLLLSAQHGVGFTQLVLQGGVGLYGRKEERKASVANKEEQSPGRSGPTAQQSA